MSQNQTIAAILALASAAGCHLNAQDTAQRWPVQFHGFVSQGYAKSNNNNYLTMRTSGLGTFAFSDGAINASAQIINRLRVGAQIYSRNIGDLGDWRPVLDWAVIDFKVNDWLSARGGKVKTVFGLYNDSQDMESLHTWAILPQSVYALDLRSSSIAHLGGDLAGEIPLRSNRGGLAYTAYAGRRFDDKRGGYRNVAAQAGGQLDTVTGWMAGGDLRWNNLTPGLSVGASFMLTPFEGAGKLLPYNLPVTFNVDAKAHIFYADYLRGKFHLNAEYNRGKGRTEITGVPGMSAVDSPYLGWYASFAYRVATHLELGAYHARFVSNTLQAWNTPDNHIYDQVITARVDVNRHWSLKLEGHFIDGFGSIYSAHGFYLRQNPNGYQPKTNMFVFRTGYTF